MMPPGIGAAWLMHRLAQGEEEARPVARSWIARWLIGGAVAVRRRGAPTAERRAVPTVKS